MEKITWDNFSSPETDALENKYLPHEGEGDTHAHQAVTATSKLIYKWFNDGDVYDNTHMLSGWANDLSSYANWLDSYIDGADVILERIDVVSTDQEYVEKILWPLHNLIFSADLLAELETHPKHGTIYDCDGPFVYSEESDEEDEDDNMAYCSECGCYVGPNHDGGPCDDCAEDDEDYSEDE